MQVVDKKTLGLRIRALRVDRRETMDEFAEAIQRITKVTRPNKSGISKWEHGENKPNAITLKAIAKLGHTTVTKLMSASECVKIEEPCYWHRVISNEYWIPCQRKTRNKGQDGPYCPYCGKKVMVTYE
ncbi:MAG: helix-turn-helix transcriptional regulator [Aerococcus sp.]|nr:helix-turn-helix transcriptional regulator [Aerococcus sp.]